MHCKQASEQAAEQPDLVPRAAIKPCIGSHDACRDARVASSMACQSSITRHTSMPFPSIISRSAVVRTKYEVLRTLVHITAVAAIVLLLRPMTMEPRCSKVIFPNYSKKKPAEDTLVPPQWGTREKNVCFSRVICSRCCTWRNLRFHVENSQHADQKQLTRR